MTTTEKANSTVSATTKYSAPDQDSTTETELKTDVVVDMDYEPDPESMEYFEWKDINVVIEGKQILYDICGRVGKGRLLGILGGSGAGKTTLLNAIAGRLLSQPPNIISKLCCIKKCQRTGTEVSGTVAYKQQKFKLGLYDVIKYISAYVMQSDILCATATGEEALNFSAVLKLPSNISLKERQQLVENVLSSLKLDDCKTTMIGNEAIRGMSGGERKRTSVAIELISNPDLIFLDEPTSGLDSFTALKTLEILKGLTKQGKQVIATIHQPSSEIFSMLDDLCILAKGYVVYYGPSSKIVEYFQSLPAPADNELFYHCPHFTNPADFVINHVQQNSEFFIEQWKRNEDSLGFKLDFKNYTKLVPKTTKTANFFLQMYSILVREFKNLARDPRPSKIRLIQTVVFAFLVGLLYYQLPHTQEGMRDRFGAVFFLTVNSSMTGLISTIVLFPEQRLLFERERNNNMYSTTTYLFAKSLVHIPEQAVFAFLYQVIMYWMIGMDSPFFALYISLVLCTSCTGSIGMVIGCFANNAGEAMQLMPLSFIPFLLFAGFLVSLDQIPVWLRWLQWIDPFKYMVDALSYSEFTGVEYETDDGQFGYPNGDDFLKSLDVTNSKENLYFDWYMLVVLLVGYRLLTWLILVKRNGW